MPHNPPYRFSTHVHSEQRQLPYDKHFIKITDKGLSKRFAKKSDPNQPFKFPTTPDIIV